MFAGIYSNFALSEALADNQSLYSARNVWTSFRTKTLYMKKSVFKTGYKVWSSDVKIKNNRIS
jgi:hypothetical protein